MCSGKHRAMSPALITRSRAAFQVGIAWPRPVVDPVVIDLLLLAFEANHHRALLPKPLIGRTDVEPSPHLELVFGAEREILFLSFAVMLQTPGGSHAERYSDCV